MSQLDELMDDLARARDSEAAARMDVADREADEVAAARKVRTAQGRLMTCIEYVRRARVAINDFVDWQTRSTLEEADELMKLQIEDKRK
jgi:hypothetical protein